MRDGSARMYTVLPFLNGKFVSQAALSRLPLADLKVLMKFIMTTTPASTTLGTYPTPVDTAEDATAGDDYVSL